MVYVGQVSNSYEECGCTFTSYYDKFYNTCDGSYSYILVDHTHSCHPLSQYEYCP